MLVVWSFPARVEVILVPTKSSLLKVVVPTVIPSYYAVS